MKTRSTFLSNKFSVLSLTGFLLSVLASTALAAPSTIRASVSSAEVEGNGDSGGVTFGALVISGNGRYVAFASEASNLVLGDTNNVSDVFVRDLLTGTTRRVSVNGSGGQGLGESEYPSISPDGRYVAFASATADLVPGDTNGYLDVFVRDLKTGVTKRASLDSSGNQGNEGSLETSVSANGRYVVFQSYASNLVENDNNGVPDIFVRDLVSGTTRRISVDSSGTEANDSSQGAVISANGRYVAFQSFASNLVSGDDNTNSDVFIHDLKTGTTRMVSVNTSGEEAGAFCFYTGVAGTGGASISADGRYVAFQSFACDLVPDDTNDAQDIFVRDLKAGVTRRASVNSNEVEGNGDIFTASYSAAISGNGRFVAFTSSSNNLVPGDNNSKDDIFLRDLKLGTTQRMSVSSFGTESNGDSGAPSVSTNGGRVAFNSAAYNLVPGDNNAVKDVFVRIR
ncbi:TolB family protein [Methylosarcina fibrata]|uniref:TolB family protein n=1 Tax=Methylosarcina fibrata TaxID=105972 RepID=UPI0003787550|nr:PD40 domain-containing protein [Methylosarcina fibrata]